MDDCSSKGFCNKGIGVCEKGYFGAACEKYTGSSLI